MTWFRRRQPSTPLQGSDGSGDRDREQQEVFRVLLEDARGRRDIEVERARGHEAKCTFVAAVATFLLTLIVSSFVNTSWLLGAVPFAFSLGALIIAIVGMWPKVIKVPGSGEMKEDALKKKWTAAETEDALLDITIAETEERQASAKRKWNLLKWGFVLSAGALVTYLTAIGILVSGATLGAP